MSVLRASGITKTFRGGDGGTLSILNGVNLEVRRGEMIAIVGASGAGKSTLLHVLGALDRPTRGEVWIDGENVEGRSDEELATLRNRKVGFVFQFHHLLREFSALENVMMPLRIGGMPAAEARARAERLLDRVGLSPRRDHHPSQLSGGEQQRTAIARSLISNPTLVLADEPTANLDHRTGETVVRMLRDLCSTLGVTVVASTHDPTVADEASRVVRMRDGQIVN